MYFRILGRFVRAGCIPALLCFWLNGCGDIDGGGSDKSGSLFSVGNIASWYLELATENQVDIVQDLCTDLTAEPFSDHFAKVELFNKPLPNTTEQTATTIHLTSYQIRYSPQSPQASALGTLLLDDTSQIPPCVPGAACSATEITVMWMNLATKADLKAFYDNNGLSYLTQFTYSLEYTFFGNNEFGEPVSAKKSTSFVVTDYDHCGN
jgi:hypothetical protein